MLTKLTNANGSWTEYLYGTGDRLSKMTHSKDVSTDYAVYEYTYDDNGNIVTLKDGGRPWFYSYDNLNRLTKATKYYGALTMHDYDYTYDDVGNMITQVTTNNDVAVFELDEGTGTTLFDRTRHEKMSPLISIITLKSARRDHVCDASRG